ncbi:UNVERIFIED_CONTAM: hypothetical protein Sradi_5078000 [Sesamum radiatum]|uniref:Uncharacterized protein n=1 Tax=Sesamum radiatum TaxID=300843 RepID=A0AAW2M1Z9_SESRA
MHSSILVIFSWMLEELAKLLDGKGYIRSGESQIQQTPDQAPICVRRRKHGAASIIKLNSWWQWSTDRASI